MHRKDHTSIGTAILNINNNNNNNNNNKNNVVLPISNAIDTNNTNKSIGNASIETVTNPAIKMDSKNTNNNNKTVSATNLKRNSTWISDHIGIPNNKKPK